MMSISWSRRRISEDAEARSMDVNISVPDELYQQAVEIARTQKVSVDEVIASAFAQQMSAWEGLRQKAARGSRERFLAVLDRVPDLRAEDYDLM
jgi:hypothetical protein